MLQSHPTPTHRTALRQHPTGVKLPSVGPGAAAPLLARVVALLAVLAWGLSYSPSGLGLALGGASAAVLDVAVRYGPRRRYLPGRNVRRARRWS